jgi:hypothetical protein
MYKGNVYLLFINVLKAGIGNIGMPYARQKLFPTSDYQFFFLIY